MKYLGYALFLTLYIIGASVWADDPHVIQPSNTIIYTDSQCSGTTLAAASGQHNYKAGTTLQWSGAGAYLSGKCDSSAASFGLSKQLGRVFGAVNYTTDGSDSLVAFSFSGTF